MRFLVAILSAILLAGRAGAQVLPSAGGLSDASAGGESHAWIALPLADPEGGAAIVHLPPRRAAGRTDTAADVQEGSIRLALRLPRMPERLAAWGNRLWIAFPPDSAAGGKRPVLTMAVERGPLGGSWVSEDTEGRLPALPLLPGDQQLAGFAGSARGPVALLRAPVSREYTLLVLNGTEWSSVALPEGIDEAGVDLVCAPNGVTLAGTGGRWDGAFPARKAGAREDGAPSPVWTRSVLGITSEGGLADSAPRFALVRSGGELVYGGAGKEHATELWSPSARGCRLLATIKGVGERAALVPLDQVGRVALVWLERPGGATDSATGAKTHIAEVSALTGAVLYDGPARIGGPVSAAELKLLAMVLVGVMVVVLLFVLRPDEPGKPLSLPPGLALAEPGRRVVGAAIDVAVALVGAAVIKQVPVRELMSPGALLYDPAGVETMLLIMGLGVLHCTLGEGLLGASIGKLLVRCRVVRVAVAAEGDVTPVASAPGLWRALVRNVVRWVLAPLAIAGLNAPDHRHRGDLAAGTVVVIRVAPEATPG